jgi:hypothetical protein
VVDAFSEERTSRSIGVRQGRQRGRRELSMLGRRMGIQRVAFVTHDLNFV